LGRSRLWGRVLRLEGLNESSELLLTDVMSLMKGKELMTQGNDILREFVIGLVRYSKYKNVRAQ
jgi:hypothetical protein